ncbi:MAG: ion transporter [Bacteroidota bacterium]
MLNEHTAQRRDIPISPWRKKVHEIIFEADTPAGKLFDVLLLLAILLSTLAVMLESVRVVEEAYSFDLKVVEWVFTILFSLEYIARIVSVGKPLKYIFSFYGIIDLLSILPTYLGLFIPNSETLSVIRTIRLMRVFRIFKLTRYVEEAEALLRALQASRWKITVFLGAVLTVCMIMGSLMYLIEGRLENEPGEGFTSIPRSIYWAIVTLTTVGYGDIAPVTALGQAVSALIMIMGYSILAVPTGIISVELSRELREEEITTRSCSNCAATGHDADAVYCKNCGAEL